MATLRQTNPIKLDFDVPERFAGRIDVGMPVRFRSNGSASSHQAHVYALEPGIDQNTRSLRVRALSPNPADELRPGEFVQVELTLADVPDAVLIPSTALLAVGGRNAVFVARKGTVEQRAVELGMRTVDRVQILSGLVPGDTVVTRGTQLLRDGSAVQLELP